MPNNDDFEDLPRDVRHDLNNRIQIMFNKLERDINARFVEMERRIDAKVKEGSENNFASIGIRSNDARDELRDLIRFVREFKARRQRWMNEGWISVIRWTIPAALGAGALWVAKQLHINIGQ